MAAPPPPTDSVLDDPALNETTTQVSGKLAHAWTFLTGQTRAFAPTPEVAPPPHTRGCFLLPLDVAEDAKHCAIVVLIPPEDAQQAATHMFGLPSSQLADADLADACAETCNLFSDCIVMHLSGEADVRIGLPCLLDEDAYVQACRQSHIAAQYASPCGSRCLSVLVLDPYCPPSH